MNLKSYFVKASSSNDSKYIYNYCIQNGHAGFSCPIKKNTYFGVVVRRCDNRSNECIYGDLMLKIL